MPPALTSGSTTGSGRMSADGNNSTINIENKSQNAFSQSREDDLLPPSQNQIMFFLAKSTIALSMRLKSKFLFVHSKPSIAAWICVISILRSSSEKRKKQKLIRMQTTQTSSWGKKYCFSFL